MGEKRIDRASLILGILFLFASLIAFLNPLSDLYAVTFLFGVVAVVNGIWLMAYQFGMAWRIALGIIDIILGIFILVNPFWGFLPLPSLFAIWFIVNSILNFSNLRYTKILGKNYFWLSLILNIFCIIAGVLLLFNSVSSVLTLSFLVGFYFMLAGDESLILSFNSRV